MRAVVQRVKKSSVSINEKKIEEIDKGLLVLLGVSKDDTEEDAKYLADKIVNLRIFEDTNCRMNRSLLETGGKMLIVSQFTLLGDCRKGRRPSFVLAARPDKAKNLYKLFISLVSKKGITVKTGCFGAMMDVSLINDGPVTLILETKY